jgi:hypothetical protein
MKYIFPIFLMLAADLVLGQTPEKKLSFCTDVGPVELQFDGDSVRGSYRITVVKEPFNGVIKGTFKEGLLDGVWIDPDGSGHILFGFTEELNQFTAFFNNYKKPGHWFPYPWRGATPAFIAGESEERKKIFRCDWK